MFSFDLSSMFTTASDMFTSFGPIIALVGGIYLGVGLVKFVLSLVRNLF